MILTPEELQKIYEQSTPLSFKEQREVTHKLLKYIRYLLREAQKYSTAGEHGNNRYTKGCRCQVCTEGRRIYIRRHRAMKSLKKLGMSEDEAKSFIESKGI